MLASLVSDQVDPFLQRAQQHVLARPHFHLRNCGIIEDGDRIGVIGLRCDYQSGASTIGLSFGVVLTRLNVASQPVARGSVSWLMPSARGGPQGWSVCLAKIDAMQCVDQRLPLRFLRELARLEKMFVSALHQNGPPSANI